MRASPAREGTRLGAAAVGVLAIAVGCSSSTSAPSATGAPDAGAGSCTYVNPVAAAGTSGACASCLAESCSAQLATYASAQGCADYIACVCPGGAASSNAGAIEACQNSAVSDSCVQAATAVDLCEDQSCSQACGSGPGAPVADGGDAGPVNPGPLVDASLSATCESYVACCVLAGQDAGIPLATVQTDCEQAASLLTDAQCEAYLVAYQDAGVSCSP